MEQADPKTVIRAAGRPGDVAALGRPLVALAGEVERAGRPEAAALAAELRARVEAFEHAANAAGLGKYEILAARDALVAVVDARARGNPALDAGRWGKALRAQLRLAVATAAEIRAAETGAAARGERSLARFLGHCREAVEGVRPAVPRRRRSGAPLVAGLLALLLGWAAWAEWRYRAGLLDGLASAEAEAAAAETLAPPSRAATLDAFAATVARVGAQAAGSPLGLIARVPWMDPGVAARARYADAARALAAQPLADAVEAALATEGDAVALYDSLRAAAILEGRSAWQPRFLAAWISARSATEPDLAGLAPHVMAMSRPEGLTVSDLETRAEAQRLAAEGPAAPRAYLELERADAVGALTPWRLAEAAPGGERVLVRRSGAPIGEGLPGLYTTAGWDAARDGAAVEAVARAAQEGEAMLGRADAADVEAVLDILQTETLAAWRDYLGDLRVRPFADQPAAVMITGALGVRDTPLSGLIREVWRQAGGVDRSRSHSNQLGIAAEFGPAIQFVEAGRMDEIVRLFASLNVALQLVDVDTDLASRRLMDVQSRAAAIAALSQAPRLVVEIVEDVLAQTAASNEGLLGNRAARLWRRELAPACAAAMNGQYPFGDGPDADPVALARLLAPPGGLLPSFFAEHLSASMDVSATPWRWKPEARLAGFQPESAAFFERASLLGATAFAEGELAAAPVTFAALAQRGGAAQVALGGAAAVVATTAAAARLDWPGPDPDRGFEIAFSHGPRSGAAGPWGLLRFLDGVRLRPRLEGQRFLADVQFADVRLYLQVDFDSARNPVAARLLMRGLACPASL